MIFSGHILYRIIKRMKVFKSFRKYYLRSKIGLYTSDESSFLSKYSKYSEIVSICFEIYLEEMMTPSEFQRKFEIFAENFIPFQYFPTLFHHFQPFSTQNDPDRPFSTSDDLKLLYFPVQTRENLICTPPKVHGAYRESPKIPGSPIMAT